MNLKMLSEKQKRIVSQELFRKLILAETKKRVSRKDYRIIRENYDLLMLQYLKEEQMQDKILLNEGVGDFFNDLWGKTKAAMAKLGDKIGPDDKEKAAQLEKQIQALMQRSAALRKEYEQTKAAYEETGVDDQKSQVELEQKRQEAGKLGAQALKLTQQINVIRKKYDLQPVKFELDDETDELKGVLAPDDGKFDGDGATEGGPDAGRDSQGAGDGAPVPEKIKDMEDDFENKKAPGIFRSIVDSYKYAFGANAAMWKSVYGFFSGAKKQPARQQDDALLQILVWLINQAQKGGKKVPDEVEQEAEDLQDEVDDDNEGGEDEDAAEDEGDNKGRLRIRSLRRPISQEVQKVLRTQGVKVDIQNLEKIVDNIMKNIADHMRANGVVFKGDKGAEESAKPDAGAGADGAKGGAEGDDKDSDGQANLNESSIKKLTNKTLIKYLESRGLHVIKEERLVFQTRAKLTNKMISVHNKANPKAFNQLEENPWEESPSKAVYNYKLAEKDPKIWLTLAKDWVITRMQKGMGKLADIKAAQEEDNNFLATWDMHKDLLHIRKLYFKVKPLAKKESPEMLKAVMNMFKKLKNQARVIQRAVGWKFDPTGGPDFKEATKRALKLKKKGKDDKGAGKKEFKAAAPSKGKVAASDIVSKSLQANGVDQEVAKKAVPIIKKKIEKIIAKHVGDDVKIVEQKVNRYLTNISEVLSQYGV